jgi:hypothetical protein
MMLTICHILIAKGYLCTVVKGELLLCGRMVSTLLVDLTNIAAWS